MDIACGVEDAVPQVLRVCERGECLCHVVPPSGEIRLLRRLANIGSRDPVMVFEHDLV